MTLNPLWLSQLSRLRFRNVVTSRRGVADERKFEFCSIKIAILVSATSLPLTVSLEMPYDLDWDGW